MNGKSVLVKNTRSQIRSTIYYIYYMKKIYLSLNGWKLLKTTLNNCGFSGLWLNQSLPCSIEVFKHSVKIRLKDQFIQKWHEIISQGGKCTVYRIIKTSFGFESYLNELPDLLRKYFTKFRC